MKKLLVSLLCAVMMVTFMPSMAFADGVTEATIQNSGGGQVSYSTLEEAVNAAKDGDTIILNQPAVCESGITFSQAGTIVLDLNGNSISSNGFDIVLIKTDDLNLEIKDGNLSGTGNETYGIYSYARPKDLGGGGYKNLNLTLRNLTINTADQAVGVQGLNTNQNVTLDSCVIKSGTLAVYHPPISGTLKIKDTNIEAGTGVMIKGGNAIIEGNTEIHATGKKVVSDKPYDGSVGGLNAPGDAVYLEGGYNRDIDVQILGGTFKSDNAFPVQKRFAEQSVNPDLVRNVEIIGGQFDVKNKEEISQVMEHLKADNTATVNLAAPLSLTDRLTLDKNVTITAEKGVNITLASDNAEIEVAADVAFKNFDVSTAIVNAGGVLGKVTVNNGKTLTISDNTGNGMNGGILEVKGGKVVANNNGSNGISAKIIATDNAEIEAKNNGYRGLTLNGGSDISGTATVVAEQNNTRNADFASDIQISTKKGDSNLANVKVSGDAKITAGTLTGYIHTKTENGETVTDSDADATKREKTLIVGNGDGTPSKVVITVKEDSKNVPGPNDTASLFNNINTKQGVVIVEGNATVHGNVGGVDLTDKNVTKVTFEENAKVTGDVKLPYGTEVKNESNEEITVTAPNGTTSTIAGGETGSAPNKPYIPPTNPVQKPVIEAEEGATVTLSKDGTTATIVVDKDATLKDVLLNGQSLGAVTEVKDLKTGDKLVVVVETAAEKNDRIRAGVENTTIKLYYNKKEIGKGWIKFRYKKSYGYKVDNYEIFRSAKKKTNFGDEAWFVTKTNKTKGFYKNGKSVKKGTRYYYKMRGVREIAGETVYTQWSNIVMRTGR